MNRMNETEQTGADTSPGDVGKFGRQERDTTRVVLLAGANRLPEEDRIVHRVEEEGFSVEIVRDLDDLPRALAAGEYRHTILMAEYITACRERPGKDAYVEFLKLYVAARQTRRMDLILLEKPVQKPDAVVVGYGDLVSAYMRIPVELDELIRFLHGMSESQSDV